MSPDLPTQPIRVPSAARRIDVGGTSTPDAVTVPRSLERWQVMLDSTSPGARQLTTVVGVIVAMLMMWVVPGLPPQDPQAIWSGVFLLAAITVAAVLIDWSQLPQRWTLVVPLLSMIAIGFFRIGTGGAASPFAVLVVLPVLWIAAEPGRRNIYIAAAMPVLVMLMPYLFGYSPWNDGQILRVIYSPLIYLMMSMIVNELTRRAREQIADERALSRERALRLQQAQASEAAIADAVSSLQASEDFNRSVWNSVVHEALIVTDPIGVIVSWAPGAERLFGVDAFKATGGLSILDFIADANLPEAVTLSLSDVIELTSRPDELGDPILMRGANGTSIPVRLSSSPRHDRAGHLIGYIFVALDVTQSQEVNRLKDEFVGLISHELRTPLASILGYLELAKDESEQLPSEVVQYLSVAERNAQRLLNIVGDLLFVAQVDAGRMPLQLQTLDLSDVVRTSIETALPTASQRMISLLRDGDEGSCFVHGDPLRLGQALDNLISNAVKFTPDGGTVTVGLDRQEDCVRLRVTDTGMGIPADEMDLLFTRFFRSRSAARQSVPGVGLGLNITKSIVLAHQGELAASSVEGEGTTFTITLPVFATRVEANSH